MKIRKYQNNRMINDETIKKNLKKNKKQIKNYFTEMDMFTEFYKN
jgi:hypothetical protein